MEIIKNLCDVHEAMAMVHSAEARWFLRGTPEGELRKWFSPAREPLSEPERIDDYLHLPNCRTASIKVRQERLEVKAQTESPKAFSIDGSSGQMDQWVKWMMDDDQMRILADRIRRSDKWIKVRKSRCVRKFSADGGTVVEVAAEQQPWPTAGCNIELAVIASEAGGPWTSLAFEAFGPPERTVQVLEETLRIVLTNRPLPPRALTVEMSYSYPVWLGKAAPGFSQI